MQKSLEEVTAFFAQHEQSWKKLARDIETAIVFGRDNEAVPIYLTKVRIKKTSSAYLKTKRKSKEDLSHITDWIGMRVLCLFQQDISPVHEFLLRLFLGLKENIAGAPQRGKCHISEVIVFNWDPTLAKEGIENLIPAVLGECAVSRSYEIKSNERKYMYSLGGTGEPRELLYKTESRGSRYKSVHYNVVVDGVTFEIQLRTLIQDVWGELEHALSYKHGKIHPHIKNSFQLLSQELEAKDTLVSQLREVSDRERSFALYASIKSGPTKWLNYEHSFLKSLPQDAEFKAFIDEYLSNFTPKRNNRSTRNLSWCDRMDKQMDDAYAKLALPTTHQVDFFFAMERAFIHFCRGDLKEAEAIYAAHASDDRYKERWVVFMRLGEIHSVRGETEEALMRFDYCETLLSAAGTNADRDWLGEYFAKHKLASVYWALGDEYIEIALLKSIEAETIYAERLRHTDEADLMHEFTLVNNLCYYSLERFLKTQHGAGPVDVRFKVQVEADKRFKALADFVDSNPDSETFRVDANAYDTLAWAAFQKHKVAESRSESETWLKKAYEYMERGDGRANTSPSPLTSLALHREHLQEIVTAYDLIIRDGKTNGAGVG